MADLFIFIVYDKLACFERKALIFIVNDKGKAMIDLQNTDPLTLQLGQALKKLRQSRGLNLEDLSRLSGVGIATLSHLENGNRDPKLSTISRILQALRSDLRDLLFPAPVNDVDAASSPRGYPELDL